MSPADTAGAGAALPPALEPLAAAPARSALFLDFDGTMATIVADPRDAVPLPGVPALLGELADEFALVAVISGRPTSFLAEALGPPAGVTLAGLYGLERALAGTEYDAWASVIDQVVGEAEAAAPEGVYVEPKGLTVTLHWRRAPQQRDWVVGFAQRAAAAHGLLVHEGRHERELRPPNAVDKGTVVRSLAAEMAGRLDNAAAFGDDVGDLPAFAALGELTGAGGRPLYTVRVAAVDTESPRQVAEQADLTVVGATGAVALLRALAEAAGAARPQP
ncbi:MAG TPA: trehalose-phosphatase [Acidimicrobiales bacterium]|nr:trehalose-phosphatase [Acidimicrobiales bacterium]